ncbi:MAG: NAD(+) synthase [Endomicrobium sp.]|jgi:NAD+ synthase (glutamine-hydrolysing)|nr:NAD(+) synthase [Endomicrobium sp.]
MKYGFVKVASATPNTVVANPLENSSEIVKLIKQADDSSVEVLVFPELCLSGYTCGELFLSDTLKASVYKSLDVIRQFSTGKKPLIFIGSPIWRKGKLYSCAVVFQNGKILGITPKTYLPSYSEFYELRHFTSGKNISDSVKLCGQNIPFGTNIIFSAKNNEDVKVSAEICEDMFVPSPPSIRHAQAGATIIVNLSASNEIIGKSDYRKTLIKAQSGRLSCGYIYSSAGSSESVSDIIFSGHRIIAENGVVIKESGLFENGLTVGEIDVERLSYERRRLNVFETNSDNYINIEFDFSETAENITRDIYQLPFVPNDAKSLSNRAELILKIQSQALAERLKFTGLDAVVGISGGLDSTLALLVILRSYEILGKDRENIIAITMPGYGTSKKTLKNVEKLSHAVNVPIRKISIIESVNKHLEDIGHKGDKDITYENAQARERTQILMDIANSHNGCVIGTGDLSESALGWCTYNGDHMSMYAVNSSIPKTLVKHLVSYECHRVRSYEEALTDILNTDISPELLPLKDGEISQKTESIIGPYELHDFFLYYTVRFGQKPEKTLFLAIKAFDKVYSAENIKKHFKTFLKRFFFSQFKRNCFPDGIKVGTISLSPRGDWRMATESSSIIWLQSIIDSN